MKTKPPNPAYSLNSEEFQRWDAKNWLAFCEQAWKEPELPDDDERTPATD